MNYLRIAFDSLGIICLLFAYYFICLSWSFLPFIIYSIISLFTLVFNNNFQKRSDNHDYFFWILSSVSILVFMIIVDYFQIPLYKC
jgi:hypothetical protein